MSEDVRVEPESGGARRSRGDRGGGAAARRAARGGAGPGLQLTYIKRKIGVYEVLDEEGHRQLVELVDDQACAGGVHATPFHGRVGSDCDGAETGTVFHRRFEPDGFSRHHP